MDINVKRIAYSLCDSDNITIIPADGQATFEVDINVNINSSQARRPIYGMQLSIFGRCVTRGVITLTLC